MKKKSIVASILALVLCFSLVTGATYALFTSESKNNIAINAGKVEVVAALEKAEKDWVYSPKGISMTDDKITDAENVADVNNGTFYNGGTAELKDNTLKLVNVTPGDKVSMNIKITNNSNVAALYQMAVWATNDNGLFAGLKVTVDNDVFDGVESRTKWKAISPDQKEVDTVPVIVELALDAGNEYQNKSVELVFGVFAVQGNAMVEPVASVKRLPETELALTGLVDTYNKGAYEGDLNLDAGFEFTATDSDEEAKASPYAEWHADFVVTTDRAVAKNGIALAGNYGAYGWIAFASPNEIVANQEIRLLSEVLGVSMSYKELPTVVGEFKCGVAALFDSAIGTTVNVELRLYEATGATKADETGAYVVIGNYSHTIGESNKAGMPVAPVETMSANELEIKNIHAQSPYPNPINLDTGYVFTAPNTKEEAELTPYAKWNADFVIVADKDVAKDSIVLAGNYEYYVGNDWVAFTNDTDLTAESEIRLLSLYGYTVNYVELCDLIKEFKCGLAALNNTVAGTTVTVELRLFETVNNVETGNYNVIGSYSYTL